MTQELRAADPPQIGPYRLLGRLGAGGMGQVYLGRSADGCLAAVKVIRPDLAAERGFRARFAREVAAARAVSGRFTALVLDADTDGPVPWLATAYVAGPSLADAIDAHGPLPTASVLTLAAGLAEGLAAIHAAGMVHRDVKPSNVLLAADGPRLIDFGISRAAGASALTQTGMVIGSPGFMSPEQAEGGVVGPASDVFSLGAVLAFAAAGEGPFGAGSTPALVYRVVHSEPDVTRLPGPIRPLVERCLAKDPARRPAPAELLAGLGGRRRGDWLPEPLTQVLGEYARPGLAGDAGSPAPAGRPGPATVTAAQAWPAAAEPSFPAQPGAADRRPPRRGRRGPAWALLAAGVIAAATAALVVPRAIGDAPASHSERTMQARSALGSSSRPPQAKGPASASAAPMTVPPSSPGTMAGSSDPAPTAAASGVPSASPTPTPTMPAATPTPTAAPTPSPTMTTPAPAATPTPTSAPAGTG
jgi:eukaryotic-like serine/threonine-protein kinase